MGDMAGFGSDFVVLRRPHFRLDRDALFFMVSERPFRQLSGAELELWRAIHQPVAMGVLRERFPGLADKVIQEFWQSRLCELVEPAFPETRRRVLVIEPHADDAALSLAGVMWLRRHECAFTIATLASRSNFTSYYMLGRDFFDVGRVTQIRRSESELFARIVGGSYVAAGMTDAVLRYRDCDWTLDFFQHHQTSIAVATSRSPDKLERDRWTEAVRQLLAETASDEVWIPLGGHHVDHRLTTSACLTAFTSYPSLVADRQVKFYQDVPYASRFPEFTDEILEALQRSGVELHPEIIPIDDVFEQKLRLVSVYASQFKIDSMREDIDASARSHGSGNDYSEMLWTVRHMPHRIGAPQVALESTAERNQEEAALAWARRNRDSRKVRVLLLAPTGQWRADLALMCEVFPRAQFEVHVAAAAIAEVTDAASDRVNIRKVEAGSLAWGLLSLQLLATGPMPTLFHAGTRRLREAKWLSKLWVMSDTMVVAMMDPLVRGLKRHKNPAAPGSDMETSP